MDKPLVFTKHAERKFGDLVEMGFIISKEQVVDTIRDPEWIDQSADAPIAQKTISARHLLRVVFVEGANEISVVTFYPGAKRRYDAQD